MGLLAQAVQREQWELAALCLLLAALRTVQRLPPDAVVGLLEALEAPKGEEGGQDVPRSNA